MKELIDNRAIVDLETLFLSFINSFEGAVHMLWNALTSSQGRYIYIPGISSPIHIWNPFASNTKDNESTFKPMVESTSS